MKQKQRQKIMSDEFKQYIDELNIKLAEAAAAMKEVNRIKNLAGLPSIIRHEYVYDDFDFSNLDHNDDKYDKLSEMFDLVKKSELENEIGKAGWNTSSSYC